MTIFLIGPRASGKTVIGSMLANRLGLDFVDTDVHMLERDGLCVADVVAKEGWEGFRRRESQTLRLVTASNRVIATGGGIILAEANRHFMRENGVVMYLEAPADVLAARLEAQPDHRSRPSLTGKTIIEEVSEVLAERRDWYYESAHHILDAACAPGVVVEQALAKLGGN